jgi:hypothetical protein
LRPEEALFYQPSPSEDALPALAWDTILNAALLNLSHASSYPHHQHFFCSAASSSLESYVSSLCIQDHMEQRCLLFWCPFPPFNTPFLNPHFAIGGIWSSMGSDHFHKPKQLP